MIRHIMGQRTLVCLLGSLLSGLVLISIAAAEQASADSRYRPRLLLSLPEDCNTPDGMRLDPKTGDVILACPNFANPKYPGKLMKITPDNRLEPYFDRLPLHPRTGKVSPMGIDFGPDGNLYIADNQYFANKDHCSRVLRVNVQEGKPVSAEVVVDGLKLANGAMWKGDMLYLTDTFFDLPGDFGRGGVYRFSLEELRHGPVTVKPKDQPDPHLVVSFPAFSNPRQDRSGPDGLTFDPEGNLYTGNFGDGQLFKVTFEPDGRVKSADRLLGPPRLTCVDGLFCDPRTRKIYVANSERNAIQVVSPDGSMETLWENDDTTGEDGLLDQPCEVLVRGDELLVACFDLPFPGLKNRKHDSPHTISVIRLK